MIIVRGPHRTRPLPGTMDPTAGVIRSVAGILKDKPELVEEMLRTKEEKKN